jgi:hypothetical protein
MHNIWTEILLVLREYTKTLEWKGESLFSSRIRGGCRRAFTTGKQPYLVSH